MNHDLKGDVFKFFIIILKGIIKYYIIDQMTEGMCCLHHQSFQHVDNFEAYLRIKYNTAGFIELNNSNQ